MAITNYLVHFTTEATYNNKKSELRNDAVAFIKDATIIHTHGTDYYCGSGPVALKSDLSGYATTSALTSGLAGKANTSHTHTIAQVSGLQAELDSKLESVSLSDLGVTATAAELNYIDGVTSNIQTQLNSKANSSALNNYLPLTGGTLTGSLTIANKYTISDFADILQISLPDGGGNLQLSSGEWYPDLQLCSSNDNYTRVLTQYNFSELVGKNYLPLSGNEDGPYFTGAIQLGEHELYLGSNYIRGSASGLELSDLSGSTDVNIYDGNISINGTNVSKEGHTHSASNITSGTLAIARIPTGTTSSTVALGNHTHSNYLSTNGGSLSGDLSMDTNRINFAGQLLGVSSEDLCINNNKILTEANYSDYISSTDTKNTTGTSNSTSKLYLAGGTSQSSTGVQTYSNSAVYTQSGLLYATQMNATNGFYETSDARLKNFKDDIKALDVVSNIPTKYFTWKKDEIAKNMDPELHIGTSAQEIQKFYPDLVTADEDGILSVDYARLSIIALAAIKEFKAEVDKLKQQNTKFKV